MAAWARGGGGCFERGTPVLTPGGAVPIETLRAGDSILTVAGGRVQPARVLAHTEVHPREYVEIALPGRTIRVTPEHPLATADGIFRTAKTIQADESLLVWNGQQLQPTRVQAVRRQRAEQPAYNLVISHRGTYLAHGVLVHNKGCFLPDTPILRSDGTAVPISKIRPDDQVLAFRDDGSVTTARVAQVITRQADATCVVTTDRAVLHVTEEHPFFIGKGTFKELRLLKAGDAVYAFDGQGIRRQQIVSIERRSVPATVYNLQTDEPHTFFAASLAVHNKGGGCFERGTPVLTPGGAVPIETLRAGDSILTIAGGRLQPARVLTRIEVQPRKTIEIALPGRTIRVTPEHPLATGNGEFRSAKAISPGQSLLAWDGRALRKDVVLSVRRIRAEQTAYNLVVSHLGTYLAHGVLVHNKGCFLPETPILRSDGTAIPISKIRPDDQVLAFRDDGPVTTARVAQVITRQADATCVVTTDRAVLHVTEEHPFFIGKGTFKELRLLKAGDAVYAFDGQGIHRQQIVSIERRSTPTTVYNLQTDEPHTFFAAGFAVHNKGGGSHSSHRSSGGGSTSGDGLGIIYGVLVFIIVIWALATSQKKKQEENLDFCYSPAQISTKADKTRKLLEFIARQDPLVQPATLEETVKTTFLKLQECWQARQYDPMKPLMLADLFGQHLKQIQGMIRNHEINRLDDIRVDRIDLVNVRYTLKPSQREFTALITATLKDYYVDDRTGAVLRGDKAPAQFQEFWTFQFQEGRWLLREIEQSRESDALKDENFFEAFTDIQLEQVYGEAVDKTGPAGPWLEKTVATRALQLERMLNFLHETDKLWNRRQMLDRARQIFTDVYLAREAGELPGGVAAALFPDVAGRLRAGLADERAQGLSTEYRNFCVRKVELLLVRNFADNRQDEYFVRISAHAQQAVKQNGAILRQDADVTPFEEYWTLGRLDNQWKLKEILPPARGQRLIEEESLDEDSSPDQVQWYYTKKRTV